MNWIDVIFVLFLPTLHAPDHVIFEASDDALLPHSVDVPIVLHLCQHPGHTRCGECEQQQWYEFHRTPSCKPVNLRHASGRTASGWHASGRTVVCNRPGVIKLVPVLTQERHRALISLSIGMSGT
eukprot:1157245-Pelagomonas_calceolata.AAC.1